MPLEEGAGQVSPRNMAYTRWPAGKCHERRLPPGGGTVSPGRFGWQAWPTTPVYSSRYAYTPATLTVFAPGHPPSLFEGRQRQYLCDDGTRYGIGHGFQRRDLAESQKFEIPNNCFYCSVGWQVVCCLYVSPRRAVVWVHCEKGCLHALWEGHGRRGRGTPSQAPAVMGLRQEIWRQSSQGDHFVAFTLPFSRPIWTLTTAAPDFRCCGTFGEVAGSVGAGVGLSVPSTVTTHS